MKTLLESNKEHLDNQCFINTLLIRQVLKDRRRQGTVDVHATNNTWKTFMRCVHQRAKSSK